MGLQRNIFSFFFLTGHYTSVEELKSGSIHADQRQLHWLCSRTLMMLIRWFIQPSPLPTASSKFLFHAWKPVRAQKEKYPHPQDRGEPPVHLTSGTRNCAWDFTSWCREASDVFPWVQSLQFTHSDLPRSLILQSTFSYISYSLATVLLLW